MKANVNRVATSPALVEMKQMCRMLAAGPRMDLLRILADGPKTSKELAAELRHKSLRPHLTELQDAGILAHEGDSYALGERVELESTSAQHNYTVRFTSGIRLILGMRVWDGKRTK